MEHPQTLKGERQLFTAVDATVRCSSTCCHVLVRPPEEQTDADWLAAMLISCLMVRLTLVTQDESSLVLVQDIDWVQTEKHVFEQASSNPFLVGLHSCFQTQSR